MFNIILARLLDQDWVWLEKALLELMLLVMVFMIILFHVIITLLDHLLLLVAWAPVVLTFYALAILNDDLWLWVQSGWFALLLVYVKNRFELLAIVKADYATEMQFLWEADTGAITRQEVWLAFSLIIMVVYFVLLTKVDGLPFWNWVFLWGCLHIITTMNFQISTVIDANLFCLNVVCWRNNVPV